MYLLWDKDAFPVAEEGREVCFRLHCRSLQVILIEQKIKSRTVEITH